VGGGIGNNTCGAHSVIYGKTLDHIRELDVILSDGSAAHFGALTPAELESRLSAGGLEGDIYRGVLRIAEEQKDEIDRTYARIQRRVSGYNLDEFILDGDRNAGPVNLARMVVGSEGTLCVVTEARVNLVPRPTMTSLSVLHFRSVFDASEATMRVLRHDPSSVEMIDKMVLDRCRDALGQSRLLSFIDGDPGAMLIVEFYGESETELTAKMDGLKADIGLAYACVNILDRAGQAAVWNVRKGGLGLLMSIRGDAKPIPFVEDPAVDPSVMGDFVRRFDQIVTDHGTTAGYYGHAAVGCLHIRPMISLKGQEGIDKMVSIGDAVSDLIKEFGGSMSGEHGDGIVRGVWTRKMFGDQIYNAFRELKHTWDPGDIMNPGKIIDTPPMTENLRYGTAYQPIQLDTALDFSSDFGYSGAVEMCNGMGACRKLDGSMCPSFMATRDEEHSTRGRANLLRAALSGRMLEGAEGSITDQRLHQALDLCLECKACKAECESGVDMAKLKYEFLNHYHEKHGVPLRSRIFANINALNRLGSRYAPVTNWMTGNRLGRSIASALFGVSAERKQPPFARQSLPDWFAKRNRNAVSPAKFGTVALYNDTFMNYNYPEIGIAAVELLEAAGYEVELVNGACCGRPMISKGLLEQARQQARDNLGHLATFARRGVPVVGCEPSCLLTLRDEYPDFVTGEDASLVAGNSFLIDEFLATAQSNDRLDLAFSDLTKRVLFHGHCHQKAIVGTDNALAALNMPPGYEAELINAGCCGMAGSFGFEREHYDISMQIGGLSLFPAIEAKPDWEVAVMGVSCRQQVEHGTGRRARHLVEVLRDAVV
jgi:Fe-S oxidoreductase/FAD/FMN-containing dehydrogenase